MTVSLRDRFGDNGLVSVAGQEGSEVLDINTWLVSCACRLASALPAQPHHETAQPRRNASTALRTPRRTIWCGTIIAILASPVGRSGQWPNNVGAEADGWKPVEHFIRVDARRERALSGDGYERRQCVKIAGRISPCVQDGTHVLRERRRWISRVGFAGASQSDHHDREEIWHSFATAEIARLMRTENVGS